MQQTAVEWFANELFSSMVENLITTKEIVKTLNYFDVQKMLEQAKEMERQQIIDAYLKDIGKVTIDKALVHWDKAEEYYNEIFKSE